MKTQGGNPVSKIDYFDWANLTTDGRDESERELTLLIGYLKDHIASKREPQISQDHLNLFAEVYPASNEREPDSWFINGNGLIFSLEQLEEPEAEQIKIRYDQIKSDITEIARQHTKRKEESIAKTLVNSLIIPDQSSVYAGEFQNDKSKEWHKSPVTINWGFRKVKNIAPAEGKLIGSGTAIPKPDQSRPLGEVIPVSEGQDNDRPPNPVVPQPIQAVIFPDRNKFWVIWSLVTILILIIIYLLIPACGIKNTGMFQGCVERLNFSQNSGNALELRNRINSYEKELLFLKNKCNRTAHTLQSAPLDSETNNTIVPEDVGDRLRSEQATIGDLNFSLVWNGLADLDLNVRCPGGEEISYSKKINSCGQLDVDANAGQQKMPNPIEHILINEPQVGLHKVQVSLYNNKNVIGDDVSFQLEIYSEDQSKSLQGTARLDLPWSYSFNYESIK
jgi:hypothetical protein